MKKPRRAKAAANLAKVANFRLIEIQTIAGEGHYVLVDGLPWARFSETTDPYEDAARCCAQITAQQIKTMAL